MENKLFSVSVAVVLVGLLVLLSDPFMVWMPMGAQLAVLIAAAAVTCAWAGFVMYERAHDEREMTHKMHSGRVAYLSGLAVLTIALVVQGFAHSIDPWIPTALGVMVVSKLVARLYAERYR